MKIGMIGIGNIGGALATYWGQAGHDLLLSFSHDAQKLQTLAEQIGASARAGTPAEAAQFGDVVVLSVPWPVVNDALREAGSLAGKVLIDTTNPYRPDMSIDAAVTTSTAEEIAKRAPGTRVVKAFNTLHAATLRSRTEEGIVLFYCGDDAAAKAIVASLINDAGFIAVDDGPLANARRQEPHGELYIKEVGEDEARQMVGAPAQR